MSVIPSLVHLLYGTAGTSPEKGQLDFGAEIPGGGGREARCILYMDDVTVLTVDRGSIDRVLERTEWFGEASGAKLNRKKTVLKLYGQWGEIKARTPFERRGG